MYYLLPGSPLVSCLAQVEVELLIGQLRIFGKLLFFSILGVISLHRQFENCLDLARCQLLHGHHYCNVAFNHELLMDGLPCSVHAHHVHPGTLHTSELLGFDVQSSQELLPLSILVPPDQVVYGFGMFLVQQLILLVDGHRLFVFLLEATRGVLLLLHDIPVSHCLAVLCQEVLLRLALLSLVPNSLSHVDDFSSEITVFPLPSLLYHNFQISVALPTRSETLNHGFLRWYFWLIYACH